MSQNPPTRKTVRKWLGQISNHDGSDLPLGAFESIDNFELLTPGSLVGRRGKRPVVFDNAIAATTNTIISMTRFRTGHADWIVYEDSAGNLKIGRNGA